jgi:hypothetical protein
LFSLLLSLSLANLILSTLSRFLTERKESSMETDPETRRRTTSFMDPAAAATAEAEGRERSLSGAMQGMSVAGAPPILHMVFKLAELFAWGSSFLVVGVVFILGSESCRLATCAARFFFFFFFFPFFFPYWK